VNDETLVKKMSIQHIVRENIRTRYKFEKTLGEGAFGKVKIASLHSDPSRKFAIKSIPRHLMDDCCGEKDKTNE
jgi:serine/threonine protein kinase